MLLLDTHVLLWLLDGNPTLSDPVRRKIETDGQERTLFVSAISFWEIGLLARAGRINLFEEANRWVADAIGRTGSQVTPFTPEIAIQTSLLPGQFHKDPADRILVATARALGAALATRDRLIHAYAAQGHLSVLAV
ncbi:MAG: type II toxin-antitoxin system VapC family toxin [Rhodospirillales bacterium]